jgi:hypothetical protein
VSHLTEVILVSSDNDGAAWFKDGKIYINIRWLNTEQEAEWFIDESFMHEYVEHLLGLGHERAVYIERVLRELLYKEWYGVHPLKILYGKAARPAKSAKIHASKASARLERVAPLQHV